jgi:pyruvate ferredoxin oxidoreductase gamma subunit/2-oxoisovalerate ferredoxin oxidoreductase gamma subunit
MQEIRFHGRGGQGTVVATVILAKAFFKAGWYVQTFPVFGVERRGAPVEAYLRLDDKKILIRSNLYTPDHVVVQDAKLLGQVDVTRGLKPGGFLLLNAPAFPEDRAVFSDFRMAVVDAAAIALDLGLGTRTQPIINTAMIGAFAGIFGGPPMEALTAAIDEEIPTRREANIQAARRAFDGIRILEPSFTAAASNNR